MLSLLVTILVMCLIFAVIWWVLSLLPLPPPFGQIIRVVVAVIFLIYFIWLLVPFAAHPLLR